MAAPTRAVQLTPIGETPTTYVLHQEEVAAYKVVQQCTTIVQQIAKAPPNRRNAATEAATRLYAVANFR
jgi:hypothetical protein